MGWPRPDATRRALAAAAAVAVWIAVDPLTALARGGGGGHGGGGGFIGGGGGGAGGAGSIGVAIVVALLFGVVLIAIVMLRARAGAASRPEAVIPEARREPDTAVIDAVAALRARDPGFDPETFLQRSEMAFLLVKRAYQDRDAGAAKAYLSPQFYATWSAQIAELTASGLRPLLENLNVRGMEVARVWHDEAWDQVTVHLDYVAASRVVEEATGAVKSGTTEDTRHGEDWTFARRIGAVTPADGGTTSKRCPHCGAPQADMRADHCEYCRADFSSGLSDWVVTGVAETGFHGAPAYPSGFGGRTLDAEEGVAALRVDDPTFDDAGFVARARQAFVSLQSAWEARDLQASRAFMSPGLYMGWSSQVQQLVELHKINHLDKLELGECAIVQVVHGTAIDCVTTRMRARCADYEVDERTGKVIFGSTRVRPFTEYWTFQRGRGVQTTGRHTVENVCPNCGAPLQINEIGDCTFCKAAVTSGRFDWVLSRIEQEEEWAGR